MLTYKYSPKLYHANSMNTGPDFNFRVYFFNVPPIPGYGSYWNYSYVMLIIKKYPDKKKHPYTPIPILIWTTNHSKGNYRLNQLSLVVRMMHL